MMNFDSAALRQILGAVAVLLGLIGYIFYIRGILQGKVKPHAFSWLVWGILTVIATLAQVVEGGGAGAWVTGFTALMSFGFAVIGLGASSRILIAKADWLFFIGALFAIPPWYFTGDPLWSVIIITVVDAVAFAPTFRKAYFHPESENVSTYVLSSIVCFWHLCSANIYYHYGASSCIADSGEWGVCHNASMASSGAAISWSNGVDSVIRGMPS
jgi:hypothetical protein